MRPEVFIVDRMWRGAIRRRARGRGVGLVLVCGLLAGLLWTNRAPVARAQEDVNARLRQQASVLTEEQKRTLLESSLSADQARSLLLEQGFSPSEVDAILKTYPPGTFPGLGLADTGKVSGMTVVPAPLEVLQLSAEAEEKKGLQEEKTELPLVPSAEKHPGLAPETFGIRLFARGPSSFTPPARVAVGPDYVLGPDDAVVIHAWGPTELSYSLTVNPEGYIVVPEIGLVYLSGRTLAEARAELESLFDKFYSGISLHVTVGQLRTVQVYVVGEVTQPGAYALSSLSTVFTALYNAGGPTEYGSFRKIRLIRRNEVLAEVDLYEYLLRGERSNDLRLENDDTIFVPPAGQRVTLLGEIRRPAVYEILPGESLQDVIGMAGGVLATGYLGRVQIDRILENKERVVVDVESAAADSSRGFSGVELSDADVVRVFPVLPGYENTVWISGAVKRPGRYELRDGMTLLGLVQSAQGLLGDAYLPRVEIQRTEPDLQIRLLAPDLGAILRGDLPDVPLADKDVVEVRSIWELTDREQVEILGEVRKPGRYVLASNMTLRDLIFRAGGLLESAYLLRAEIARIRTATEGSPQKSDIIPVRLADVISEEAAGKSRYPLQAGDKVFIRRIPQWDSLHTVTITGEVRFPGVYAVTHAGETLADLVQRAGGVSNEAFLEAAVLERRDEGRVVVDFPKAVLEKNPKENPRLVDGDWIFVPKLPETVQVRGAVFRPSSLKFVSGKSAEYYIRKCGGFLDRANRGSVRITRTNGEVVASRRLWFDPSVQRGDVIVVPFKEEKKGIDWEKIAYVANTIAGLATTVYLLTEAVKK